MKVILTGGKFNKVHPGHVWLLCKAKKLGKLIIVLANDKHNKKPYAINSRKRKTALEKLGIADKIVIGSPKSFVLVLKKYKPNVIVLGYDQKLPKETKDYVKKNKIKTVKLRKYGSHSTRKICAKL
ncbi:MAG TPA: adenylyltransferase/cytidyltransferase family protein [archaeon]|nr:adenylyltransferase/cytidyltransferase family protein [archaeon]